MKRTNIPKRLRFEVLQRDGFRCQYCGAPASKIELHVDHIHPVAAGGTNDPLNLITACIDCNAGKGAGQMRRVGRRLSGERLAIGTPVIHKSFHCGGIVAAEAEPTEYGTPRVALRLVTPRYWEWAERSGNDIFRCARVHQLRVAPMHYFGGRWFVESVRAANGYLIEPFQDQGWSAEGPDDFCGIWDSYEEARAKIEMHAEEVVGGALQFLNGQEGALH